MGTIVSVQSGYPFTPVVSSNRSNSGVLQGQPDRPDIVTAASIAANPCTVAAPCAYTPVPFNSKTAIDPHKVPGTTGIFWFNPNMFELQPTTYTPTAGPGCAPANLNCYTGRLGDSGRNILRGPGFDNWDFSLVKDTKVGFLGEAGNIQFRAEFFNLLNHTNFAVPGSSSLQIFNGPVTETSPFQEAPGASSGLIQSIVGNPRQIQFALKVIF